MSHPKVLKADGRPLRLAGIPEACDVLGLSRTRTKQLLATAAAPRPIGNLAAGPVYDVDDLEDYAATRNKTGGRPRTKAAA